MTGAALKWISGFSLTNEIYWTASTILKERYGNKQAIVSTPMGKLANLPVVISDANITGLQKLFNKIESNVRRLESYSHWLMVLLIKKVRKDIGKAGNTYKKVIKRPFDEQKKNLFNTVGDWDNMDRVITQTRNRAFQTLGWAF